MLELPGSISVGLWPALLISALHGGILPIAGDPLSVLPAPAVTVSICVAVSWAGWLWSAGLVSSAKAGPDNKNAAANAAEINAFMTLSPGGFLIVSIDNSSYV